MTLLAYAGVASPMQRLHPLLKVAWMVLLVVLASITLRPLGSAALLGYLFLVAVVVGRLKPWSVVKPMLPFVPVALGYTVFNLIFVAGPTKLFHLGPLAPSLEGFTFGLAITFRVLVILLTAVIFSTTTEPRIFALSLIQNLRVPYKYGYGLYVGLRFIPIVTDEFQTLQAAHLIRGVGYDPGVRGRIREYMSYAVPLLATMIRKAVRTAIAMDSKGFGARRARTYVDTVVITRGDLALTAALFTTTSLVYLIATRA
jgi:energy-coupling factor transport system permease protein